MYDQLTLVDQALFQSKDSLFQIVSHVLAIKDQETASSSVERKQTSA